MRIPLALAVIAYEALAAQEQFYLEKGTDLVPITCLKKTFLMGPHT